MIVVRHSSLRRIELHHNGSRDRTDMLAWAAAFKAGIEQSLGHPGGHSAVKPAEPLTRHHPHDTRRSGCGLGAAPRSEFALQRQPCVRQAALEHLATPMPFSTGYFRAWASGSRTANNGVHQLSLRARKIM